MKEYRLRISVEKAYAEALGRAIYIFAYAEWAVINCCESMQKGYIQVAKTKTAGDIADKFLSLAESQKDTKLREECISKAKRFKKLVTTRNDLVHVNPATMNNGEQRLLRHGVAWQPETINDASDKFAEFAIALNGMYNNRFK